MASLTESVSTTSAPTRGEETRATPPTTEVGVTGTANFGGDILAESNQRLVYQQAYGTAGTREWGEWEELARTNPWVASGLDFITAPIRDASVDVAEAAEGTHPNPALAKQQADFVREVLTASGPSLAEFLTQATRGMLGVGFSVFEPVFGRVTSQHLPGGEGWGLSRLAQRLPATLAYNAWVEDAEGRDLVAVRQQGPRGQGWWSGLIPAERILLFSWQRSGNNYAGFSAFRAVWYLGQIQKELLRLVGVTYQREGAGIPVASAADINAPLTQEQRRQLQQVLSGAVYHEAAAVVMPPGWRIDWVFSGGANKGHVLEAWRQLGIVILQQVQAQQLALGTNDTGSRAVGAVHDASAMAFVQSVAAQLEAVLNGVPGRAYTGLVKRLVDANWGPQPAYPKLKLTPPRAQLSPDARLAAVRDAVTARVLTPTLDVENAVREVLGFSPITDEERGGAVPVVDGDGAAGVVGAEKAQDTALNGAQVQAATDLMQRVVDGVLPFDAALEALVTFFNIDRERAMRLMKALKTFRPASGAGEDGAASLTLPRAPNPRPLTASAPRGAWVPRRPLRASEERTDWGGLAEYLETARESFEEAARPVVVKMLTGAAGAITAAMEDGDPSEVATLPLDTAALEALVGEYLEAAREYGQKTATAEIQRGLGDEVAKQREEGVDAPLRAAVGDEPEEAADDVTDAMRRQAVRRMVSRLRLELEEEAIDTLRTGGDSSEVVARTVARQLDSGAFKADAALLTAKALNVGRDEAARLMGGVEEVEYSAILDSATCSPCQQMDGRRAPFNSQQHDAMLPPNRDCEGGSRCRCVLVFLGGES